MEDRDKETQQSQSKSRILSPDQVEEIDTTFNNVFNKAKNDGIIRDSRTYRSFDEIFEISMRLHKGEKVTDEELYRPVAGLQLLRVQSPRVEALSKVDTSRFETRCSMDVTPNVERHSGEPHRVETPNVGKQNAEASSAVHSSVEKPSVERRSVEVRQLEEMQIEQPTITETEVVETTTSRKVRIEASPKEDITMNELAFSDEETSQSKPRRMEITPPVTEERPKKGVKRKRSEQSTFISVPNDADLNSSNSRCSTRSTKTILGKQIYRTSIPRIHTQCSIHLLVTNPRMEKRTTSQGIGSTIKFQPR